MINITKAPPRLHTVEQKSRIHLSGVFHRRSPSRAGSGRWLCERGEERRGEERRDIHPEMLCRLEEDEEMSLLELQQRVDCVLTHVVSEVGYCAMLLFLLSRMREREALLAPTAAVRGRQAVAMETEIGQFSHIDSWRHSML
ncbi:unnamed protein product [Leuciscus chuanchicus]